MEKRIEQLSFRTDEGQIFIEQEVMCSESQLIIIIPAQVPLFIEWPKEAVEELAPPSRMPDERNDFHRRPQPSSSSATLNGMAKEDG